LRVRDLQFRKENVQKHRKKYLIYWILKKTSYVSRVLIENSFVICRKKDCEFNLLASGIVRFV